MTDLENLARYEGSSPSLQRVEIDIAGLVQGIVRNHAPQFRAKGVGLEFAAADGTATWNWTKLASHGRLSLITLKFVGVVGVGVCRAPMRPTP